MSVNKRKRFGNGEGQSQTLKAKVNSLPVVVNAVIGGDMSLHFKCGAPHSDIPNLELNIKPISKTITGL